MLRDSRRVVKLRLIRSALYVAVRLDPERTHTAADLGAMMGAQGRIRTDDLPITSETGAVHPVRSGRILAAQVGRGVQ